MRISFASTITIFIITNLPDTHSKFDPYSPADKWIECVSDELPNCQFDPFNATHEIAHLEILIILVWIYLVFDKIN